MVRSSGRAKKSASSVNGTSTKKAIKRKSSSATPGKKGRPSKDTSKTVSKKGKEEQSYDVEEIRGIERTRKGEIKVLIKWENYGESSNSWEPLAACAASELVRKFLSQCLDEVKAEEEEADESEETA